MRAGFDFELDMAGGAECHGRFYSCACYLRRGGGVMVPLYVLKHCARADKLGKLHRRQLKSPPPSADITAARRKQLLWYPICIYKCGV